MKHSKKKLATQAAIAIAMKKAGKKPKKYQEGGRPSAVSAITAGMRSADAAIEREEGETEDLMKGRTFIPRMSADAKAALITAGRNARKKSLEKRIARKDAIIEEAAAKEFDRDTDIDFKALEETDAMMDEEREAEEPTKNVDDVLQDLADKSEAKLKYGGKLLKKYKKRKKRNRR